MSRASLSRNTLALPWTGRKGRRGPTRVQGMARPKATLQAQRIWPHAMAWTLTGFVLSTLWWAPARWLGPVLHSATEGRLSLSDARGHWREGSAQWQWAPDLPGAKPWSLPGRLHWHIGLQGLALVVQIQTDGFMNSPIQWRWTPLQEGMPWQLSDQTLRMPLGLLQAMGAPWNTLDLQGQARLELRSLQGRRTDGRWQSSGQAQLTLTPLRSALSPLPDLGHYQLQFDAPEKDCGLRLQLRTQSGALRLSGQGRWQDGVLAFRGEAQAAPGAGPAPWSGATTPVPLPPTE